jgi:hypothetical protein
MGPRIQAGDIARRAPELRIFRRPGALLPWFSIGRKTTKRIKSTRRGVIVNPRNALASANDFSTGGASQIY